MKTNFFKNLQNPQGNTCAGVSFLNKVANWRPSTLFTKQTSAQMLKKLQNSQENTCAGASFLNKVANWRPSTLFTKQTRHRCFSVNFVKFSRTPVLQGSRSSYQKCSVKKLLLKVSQCFCNKFGSNRKTPAPQSFFNKVAGLQACDIVKKRLQRRISL